MMTEEEVLGAIQWPSLGIKSGYETEQITTRNGETVTGRMLSADSNQITLVTAGNLQVTLQQTNIAGHLSLTNSMMPDGLLDGLTPQDRRDLLAFLGIRDRDAHGLDAVVLQVNQSAQSIRIWFVHHPLTTVGLLAVVSTLTAGLLIRQRRRGRSNSGSL